jgi:hypothetical protein
MTRARCPRCGLSRNARLHQILASDSFACPRCENVDGVSVPMFVHPEDEPKRGRRSHGGLNRRWRGLL